MHPLVPHFILENLHRGRFQGSFASSALFIDISGFTRVTEELMQHGQFGAEVLAGIMRTIFTPLVYSVHEQGGFVAGFAGDAITAVFPEAPNSNRHVQRALAAAVRMQEHMAANAQQSTRFGTFPFTAKVGLALGQTHWGILTDALGRRATYYFRGIPIDASATAEQHSLAGEIVADPSFYATVANQVSATVLEGFWHISAVHAPLPEAQPVRVPQRDIAQMARFFPRSLVEQDLDGEFRQILNVFIGFEGTPSHAELTDIMQHCFRLQEQYEGLLNRFDFGDKGCGLLLFWGAPISYENDLTRALEFVLALREASPVPLRAGITYRIAHAGYIGSSLAEEYTCYGRGVNLAARQMTSAGWGEIWLDGEVAQRASAEFRVQSMGEHYFKGFSVAQPVFLFLGKREQTSITEERPFFGRTQELAVLQEAIEPLFAGQFAGVTTILGEAGIGKSRLAQSFLDPLAAAQQATVFVCQTDEILRQSLNPFRSFLHSYFGQSSALSEEENKQRFAEQLQALLDQIPEPALREEIERTASFLGSLVGLRWEDSLYEQLDPELRYENTLTGLKALFKAESLRRPVIIQIEDAHWLDPDSLAFLSRLTRNVAEYPLTLLLTSREPFPEGTFDPAAPQQTLQIDALEGAVVSELAESILQYSPSPRLIRLLSERAEGNPFFVEQVLLYLRENDLLDSVEAEAGTALGGDVYIPTDVRAILTARLDRLAPRVKDVVQKAAVLGREFETPILARMMDQDPQLEPSLATAVDESVWYALDQVRYLFRHALLRDAAYDMQVQSRRRQLHELAAAANEAEQVAEQSRSARNATIAYHYDRAEIAPKASFYYGAAGEQAQDGYRNEDAITYYSRALELAAEDDVAAHLKLLNGRETIYQWLGRREQQQQDLALLQALLAEHPDDLLLSDLALRQSSYAVVTGDYPTAVSQAQQALHHALSAADAHAEAKAYHRWGRTLWQQGNAGPAKEKLEHALQIARSQRDRSLEAECLADLANAARLLGDYAAAQRYLERATVNYEAVEDEQGQVRCYNLFGVIDQDLGRYGESEQYYLRALNLCREIGWRYAEARVLTNMGNIQFDLGDYGKSRSYLEQAAGIAQEIGDTYQYAISLDTLGMIAHYTGQTGDAVQFYQDAGQIQRGIGNSRELGFVLTHLGLVLAELGDLAAAQQNLEEAGALREETGAAGLRIDTLAGLAAVALAAQRLDEAKKLVAAILAYIDDNGAEGIELPVLVYLICYRVLQAAAAEEGGNGREEAQRVLEDGYTLLANRMRRLHDEEMRSRFIEEVPYNRALRDLWLAA